MDDDLRRPIAELAVDARAARMMIINELLRCFADDMPILAGGGARWSRPELYEELRTGLWDLHDLIVPPPPVRARTKPVPVPVPKRVPGPSSPVPRRVIAAPLGALGGAADDPSDPFLTRLTNMASHIAFDVLLGSTERSTLASSAEAMTLLHADGYLRDFAHRAQRWAHGDDLAEKMAYTQRHSEYAFGGSEAKRKRYVDALPREGAYAHIYVGQCQADWFYHSGPRLEETLRAATDGTRLPAPNWPIASNEDGDEQPVTVIARLARLVRCLSEARRLDGRPVTVGQLIAHTTLQPVTVFEAVAGRLPWVRAYPGGLREDDEDQPVTGDTIDTWTIRTVVQHARDAAADDRLAMGDAPRLDAFRAPLEAATRRFLAADKGELVEPYFEYNTGKDAASSVATFLAMYTDVPFLEATRAVGERPPPRPDTVIAEAIAEFRSTTLFHDVVLAMVEPLAMAASLTMSSSPREIESLGLALRDFRVRVEARMPTWMRTVRSAVGSLLAYGNYGPVLLYAPPVDLPVMRTETLAVEIVRAGVRTELEADVVANHFQQLRRAETSWLSWTERVIDTFLGDDWTPTSTLIEKMVRERDLLFNLGHVLDTAVRTVGDVRVGGAVYAQLPTTLGLNTGGQPSLFLSPPGADPSSAGGDLARWVKEMVTRGGIPRAHLDSMLAINPPYREVMIRTVDGGDTGCCRELARLIRHEPAVTTRCNQLRKAPSTPPLVVRAIEEMRQFPAGGGGATLDWPLDNLSPWTLTHGLFLWTYIRSSEWQPPAPIST